MLLPAIFAVFLGTGLFGDVYANHASQAEIDHWSIAANGTSVRSAGGSVSEPDDEEVVEVKVKGTGATPAEAFDDAIRSALRQVVGAMVRSDTRVEEDQLVYDRVLSHSQGFIESASKSGAARLADGVFEQDAVVRVRLSRLVEVLRGKAEGSGKVDGTSLAARVGALRERKASAQEFIDLVFEDWPAKVLRVVVRGQPSAIGAADQARGGMVRVRVLVDVSVDPKKWEIWFDETDPVLKQVALRTAKSVDWTATREGAREAAGLRFGSLELFRTCMSGTMAPADLDGMLVLQGGDPPNHIDAFSRFDAEVVSSLKLARTDPHFESGAASRLSILLLSKRVGRAPAAYLLPGKPSGATLFGVPKVTAELLDGGGDSIGSLVGPPRSLGGTRIPAERDHASFLPCDGAAVSASPAFGGRDLWVYEAGGMGFKTRSTLLLPGLRGGSGARRPFLYMLCTTITLPFEFEVREADLERISEVRVELEGRHDASP